MIINNNILTDKNLDGITFSSDGRTVALTFIDMLKGEYFCEISCHGISYFEYTNDQDIDEGIPCFVGEAITVNSDNKIKLRVIGGELTINITCERIEVLN